MYVVFLHGPAASGKHTIGVELAKLTGWPLFHNHLAVDTALSLFEFGTEQFCNLRAEIWRATFREAVGSGQSFIFTFHPEATVSPTLIDELVDVIESNDGKVLFVELLCSREEILSRLGNESRTRFGKLTDAALYSQIEQEGGFEFPSLPDALVQVDTATLSPPDAAQRIHEALISFNRPNMLP